MIIPNKLKEILEKDQTFDGLVKSIITTFEPILKDKLFFFEEYTDHGIEHIEMVLKAAEFLIPDESFPYIQPQEIAILIFAIILHDIGMHTEFSTFKAMIDGKYDDEKDSALIDVLDKKTWKELWLDFLSEVRHFSSKQKENIFGNPNEIINEPDLSGKDKLDGTDKKLIGEFIRRHHARLAHEIALKGFIGNETIPFGNSEFDERNKQLAGIIARSHGINVRDTFSYLKEIAQDAWQYPDGLNVVFLMLLLRIADYLQIDKTRTSEILLKFKTLNSPVSLREHKAHLSIRHIHFGKLKESELIFVECNKPEDARMYVKIQTLIKDIQHELDLSWAILGEIYGFNPEKKPKYKFRRIDSNLVQLKLDYVPQKISFEVNNELSKLLVAPLYGNNPTFGVRELIQNATDACKERIKIEKDKGNINYEKEAEVIVSIDKSIYKIDEKKYLFKIKDNGKGMTLVEILNYFLLVGSSFRKSLQWKQEFSSTDGKSLVNRNGKFGIGILAAFLLGDEISVKTRSYKNNSFAYEFKTKIDSEYIDIKQIDDFDIGTEIEILMPNDRFVLLTQGEKDFHGKDKIVFWTGWHINTTPHVQYFSDKKELPKRIYIEKSILRNIYPQNYDRIQWAYGLSYNTFISCNDIIVALSSIHNTFNDTKNHIITQKPSLIIEDSYGILPLRLDRNDVDTDTLPFENELILDVSKDFIAQLLMLPINSAKITENSIKPHRTTFLFAKDGFALISDYIIDKISLKYNLIKVITSSNTIQNHSLIFQHSKNGIIYPEFETEIKLSWQARNVATLVGGCFLLSKEKYDNLFSDNSKNRISKWIKQYHEKEWENEDYVVYNMDNYKRKTNIFEKDIAPSIIKSMGEQIQTIQEIPFKYFTWEIEYNEYYKFIYKGGTILNQLLKKYIGDNVIIPYDMEERKKLFPLAFEELKDYMKNYEKKIGRGGQSP